MATGEAASGAGGLPGELPATVLRLLSDKLYDKRKVAAIEVEQTVKELAGSNASEAPSRLRNLVRFLVDDYALSPHANYRKGGLIGLAAVTVGLSSNKDRLEEHLMLIVPPVLHSFTDQDSRVRYYACEALYNIAKASRQSFVRFFRDVFDALLRLCADPDSNVQNAGHLLDQLVKDIIAESSSFDIEAFMPQLREGMTSLNPYVRQFLVSWITVLHSVPDIEMVVYLPDFLDGLLNMLSDANREIRQQVDVALAEFLQDVKDSEGVSADYGRISAILVARAGSSDHTTRLKAITWINEVVGLAESDILPYFADVLGAILPCLSHNEGRIRAMAVRTNEGLLGLDTTTVVERFDVSASVAVICRAASTSAEALTRKEALRWMAVLLERHRDGTLLCLEELTPAVLGATSDGNDLVARESLNVLSAIVAADGSRLRGLTTALLDKFRGSEGRQLLGRRGAFIIRGLSHFLGAESAFRELASILVDEADPQFAFDVVQALNLILITAPELMELRSLLQASLVSREGGSLFLALYPCWCHNSVAAISLCLIAQAYSHSATIIRNLSEIDITPSMLAQLDRLVQLLESPIFVSLRLQLLQPDQNPCLLESLFGILMLLPQTRAYEILRDRLRSVPMLALSGAESPSTSSAKTRRVASATSPRGVGAGGAKADAFDFTLMLEEFNRKQDAQRQSTSRKGFEDLVSGASSTKSALNLTTPGPSES